ncbi:TraB/GumN family protein [Sphingobium aquiterrae]|uniref:TraB/GumN family protein n=1 Tax=Sphingobium aquiterrae TaxID=2038656 RepID=UPI003017845A
MIRRPVLLCALLCALLLTSACGSQPALRTDGKGPALWRIEKGETRGYLFGTVHALPDDVAWETPALRDAMAGADRLVVEARGLDDSEMLQTTFQSLGQSPGLPPIPQRLPAADRPALDALLDEGGLSEPALRPYESWAAALMLSTVIQSRIQVHGDRGVEATLMAHFKAAGKPIDGLETVQQQFTAFDRLPEDAQRRLLADTVHEANDARTRYAAMMQAWLGGDLDALARMGMDGMATDPALAGPLLHDRNAAWAARIDGMRGRPFIAVGAAHLTGPGNVAELLARRGWRVTRAQ